MVIDAWVFQRLGTAGVGIPCLLSIARNAKISPFICVTSPSRDLTLLALAAHPLHASPRACDRTAWSVSNWCSAAATTVGSTVDKPLSCSTLVHGLLVRRLTPALEAISCNAVLRCLGVPLALLDSSPPFLGDFDEVRGNRLWTSSDAKLKAPSGDTWEGAVV